MIVVSLEGPSCVRRAFDACCCVLRAVVEPLFCSRKGCLVADGWAGEAGLLTKVFVRYL
jgi:hypothetical protein